MGNTKEVDNFTAIVMGISVIFGICGTVISNADHLLIQGKSKCSQQGTICTRQSMNEQQPPSQSLGFTIDLV